MHYCQNVFTSKAFIFAWSFHSFRLRMRRPLSRSVPFAEIAHLLNWNISYCPDIRCRIYQCNQWASSTYVVLSSSPTETLVRVPLLFLVSQEYNTILQIENERTNWQISSFCIDSTFLELTRSIFPSVSYSSDILYRIYRQCH